MLTYERYQALRAIYIRVPGEPGNEATVQELIEGLFLQSYGSPHALGSHQVPGHEDER